MNACDESSRSMPAAKPKALWKTPVCNHDHRTQMPNANPGIAADAATVENRNTGLYLLAKPRIDLKISNP